MPPNVFVSYAHYSDAHKTQVRQFATFLEEQTVDVTLDSWSGTHVRKNWDSWIREKLTAADYVLPIASRAYCKVFEGRVRTGKRLGTQAEAALLCELLYSDRQTWVPKMLPVVLPGGKTTNIPLVMQPTTADHYIVKALTVAGSERLLRVLFNSPGHTRPPRGTQPPHLPTTP